MTQEEAHKYLTKLSKGCLEQLLEKRTKQGGEKDRQVNEDIIFEWLSQAFLTGTEE